MSLSALDIAVFFVFIAAVVLLSLIKSRKEKNAEDFFLAGRGLRWFLIGFSIVAANISTEQFVGMSGQAAGSVGLAVSGFQLLGAVTIVFVAIFFLPRFLKAGIYTIPEYLEYRYNSAARSIMAVYTLAIYVAVTTTAVLYSGALTLRTVFDIDINQAVWFIAFVAALYATWGGLKAVAWADLIQGSGLLVAGLVTMVLGFIAIGGIGPFFAGSGSRLHMVLPAGHPEIPWTALVLGLWIPNFYYCGLNQFIVQRTLAARDLRQGQLGIIFAAALWLIVPFAIVFPGIMSLQLYGNRITSADQAYPLLIRNLIPAGLRGFILAALAGAVISSLASMLNSASTIFTMDLYKRHWRKGASQRSLMLIGRIMTILFVLIACFIAPRLADPKFGGVFRYIQEFQGYISPGIVAAFVFGFIIKKAPPAAGVAALLACVPVYGFLQWRFDGIAYLNRMAITFVAIIALMGVITLANPLREPVILPVRQVFDMRPSRQVLWLGGIVIVGVIAFFIIFW